MDFPPDSLPRVAFSFRSGTFDLRSIRPDLCFETEDGFSTAIHLDERWQSMFAKLQNLGVVLASVQSGPVCVADTWERPTFQRVPGSRELVELETGTEIRLSSMKSAMAVVEETQSQQIASIQFFDVTGAGCLKIMVTNWSDLGAFEKLIVAHGRLPEGPLLTGKKKLPPLSSASEVDAKKVETLWPGLARSLPETYFPGLEGVLRRDALSEAGETFSWQVSSAAVQRAIEEMARRHVALGTAIRNEAVFIPALVKPNRWNFCGCGQTFFSDYSQFTFRHCCGNWEAHAVRFATDTDEVICLEFYDNRGQFCGGLGVRPEAALEDHVCWNEALRDGLLK